MSDLLDLSEEQRFRLLISSVTDYAIYVLDRQGRVATWNPGAERFKGYAADEIIGECCDADLANRPLALKHVQRDMVACRGAKLPGKCGRHHEAGRRQLDSALMAVEDALERVAERQTDDSLQMLPVAESKPRSDSTKRLGSNHPAHGLHLVQGSK